MKNFETRDCCPACECKDYSLIHEESYGNEDIRYYLNQFYSSQGYIDFELLEGMTYSLLQCKNCRLIFQKEVPNENLLKILYDKWIDPSQAFERSQTKSLSYRIRRLEEATSITVHFDKSPSDFEVLDFGMGWGALCIQFKALGVNAKGLELSEPRKKHAFSQGIEVISWEDFESLNFDFINADDVLEHLVDPIIVLKSMKKSLKPGGIIKISVPNAKVFEGALKKMDWYAKRGTKDNLNGVSPLEHINCFYAESLIKMGQKCGLQPTKIKKIKIAKKTLKERLKDFYREYVLGIKPTVIYFKKVSH